MNSLSSIYWLDWNYNRRPWYSVVIGLNCNISWHQIRHREIQLIVLKEVFELLISQIISYAFNYFPFYCTSFCILCGFFFGWGVSRHTTRCTSPVRVRGLAVSRRGLRNWRSAPRSGPVWLKKELTFTVTERNLSFVRS